MKSKRKSNLMLRLASILLVCVLVSTYALSGLLARYTASSSSGDSARVIKFNKISITEEGSFEDGKAFIVPGVNLQKDVQVSFGGSESATYVFLEMELTGGWTRVEGNPTDTYRLGTHLSFGVNHNDTSWRYYDSKEDNKYVYYIELEPNEKLINEKVIANNGLITVSSDITRTIMNSGILNNINIDFRAIVVQSNGFESIGDAWNSVKNK